MGEQRDKTGGKRNSKVMTETLFQDGKSKRKTEKECVYCSIIHKCV